MNQPGRAIRPLERPLVRFAIAAAVSGVALWLAVRNVRLDGMQAAFARASLVWLLPYPIVCVVLNIVRGEIWRRLLKRRVTTTQAFWAYSVGFLANNVLPFRLGEAARVVVLSTRCRLPMMEVAAAAALERLLDMGALALMLALVAPAVAHVPGVSASALLIVLLVGGAVGAIALVARYRDRPPPPLGWALGALPPGARDTAIARWRDLARGLSALLEPAVGIPAAAGAVVVWTLTVALQWLVLRAFQPQAGVADAAFMVGAVSLAIALPAAPGFVGVYHWAGQQSLVSAFPQLYDPSTALVAAMAAHAASYVTSTALGLIGLWYFGMPLSSMTGAVRDRDRVHVPNDAYAADPGRS